MKKPGMRKLLSLGVSAVALLALVFVAMEAGSRLFWKFKYDVPLSRPGDIIYVFYPTVRTARLESRRPDPTHRDILVLADKWT